MAFDLSPVLSLPELSVKKDELFSEGYQDRPDLVSLLLSEFDGTPSPFFKGFDEKDFQKPSGRVKGEPGKFLRATARYLLEQYAKYGRIWKHAEQRKVLEKAIRLFEKSESDLPDAEKAQSLLGKARAYLYRARIIRPRGFTIPAKKIEALRHALEICQGLESSEAAKQLAVQVALEMDRCADTLPTPDRSEAESLDLGLERFGIDHKRFKDILEKGKADNPADPEAYQVWIRLAELRDDWSDPELAGMDKEKLEELETLKLALFAGSVSEQAVNAEKKKLCERLKALPFSHPLWADTVRLLRRLHLRCHGDSRADEGMRRFWKDFAIELWAKAETVAGQISALPLRWYWSRQRDLYDLAFLAAVEDDQLQKAAQIADSAKSKPALSWQAIEQVSGENEELAEIMEQYATVLAGGYIHGLKFPETDTDPKPRQLPKTTGSDSRILAFYLVHLQGFEQGYALIGDQTGWKCRKFDFAPLWEAYLRWQYLYFELPLQQRHKSASLLRELCEKLGEELAFLFEDLGPVDEDNDLLILPHDFLHRVPIHGAIFTDEEDERYLLMEQCHCQYLPAYGYAPSKQGEAGQGENVLLFFDPNESEERKERIKGLFGLDAIRDLDSFQDFKELAKARPKMMAIYCHGKADVVNPFWSKLLLKDNPTLLEFSLSDYELPGTSMFLSACETDLVGPTDTPVDEHISMPTILLQKGVKEIVGTLWEAKTDAMIGKTEPTTNEILPSYLKRGAAALFQIQRYEALNCTEDEKHLYDYLCFKLYRDLP